MTECSLVCFFDLIASPDSEWKIPFVPSSKCQLNLDVPRTLSFSEMRGASSNRSMERPPVKAVPEAVRNRPTGELEYFLLSSREKAVSIRAHVQRTPRTNGDTAGLQ